MDNGLRRVGGRRLPTRIFDVDLPELAGALTAVLRGTSRPQVFSSEGVSYVRFTGVGGSGFMAHADWEKVLVLIRDEALTTQLFPVESAVRPQEPIRFPSTPRDPLYARVLGFLSQLFTTKVPS